jgi:cytochrome c5
LEVTFFVYDGVDPKAKRVLSADLDGYGKKAVPYLCTTCHGGHLPPNPTRSDVLNMNSSFREFDLASFKFPRPGFPIDHPIRSSPNTPEQVKFFEMNNLVLATNPSPAIKELIKGWYRNSPLGQFQDPNFVPPGWERHPTNHNLDGEVKQLYQQVIATSCRTCHVAGASSLPRLPDFSTFASFSAVASLVKTNVFQYNNAPTPRLATMPHSMIAFKNFWKSENPHRPTVLANALTRLTNVFSDPEFDGHGANGGSAQGGGIDNENGKVTIAASTIAFNAASGGIGFNAIKNNDQLDVTSSIGMGDAGGVFSETSLASKSSTTLHSSIIADNFDDTDHFTDNIALRPDNLGGPFFSRDFNLIGQSADFTLSGKTTYNRLGVNPLLGLLADNGGPTFTHALGIFSPALDAGDNQILDLVSTDQRGFSRKMGYYISTPPGAVDIGAFEYGGTERDVTSQMRITRGGFYFNRNTQHYVQQVTVRNVGTTAVNGRMRLALNDLTSFVTLSNEDGTDFQFGGMPFVSFADNGMSVGGTVSVTLEFTDPLNSAITYRPRVLEVVPVP